MNLLRCRNKCASAASVIFEFEQLGTAWRTEILAALQNRRRLRRVSGVTFLLLTLIGIRQLIFNGIPGNSTPPSPPASDFSLRLSACATPESSPPAPPPLGNLRDKNTLVAIAGLLIIVGLLARNIKEAMLIGILATTLLARSAA
jgi:xanthine/uracil/vitamin C permease (AzgA family)